VPTEGKFHLKLRMTLYCIQFTTERGRDHTNEIQNYIIALVSFFIKRKKNKGGLSDNHADTCVTVCP